MLATTPTRCATETAHIIRYPRPSRGHPAVHPTATRSLTGGTIVQNKNQAAGCQLQDRWVSLSTKTHKNVITSIVKCVVGWNYLSILHIWDLFWQKWLMEWRLSATNAYGPGDLNFPPNIFASQCCFDPVTTVPLRFASVGYLKMFFICISDVIKEKFTCQVFWGKLNSSRDWPRRSR